MPNIRLSLDGRGFSEYNEEKHLYKSVVAALYDINGDNLADLVVQTEDEKLKAYLNHGAGFSKKAILLGLKEPLEKTETDYTTISPAGILNGNRGYLRRMIDVDNDGLVDMIVLPSGFHDITKSLVPYVHYNVGDHFLPGQSLPQVWERAKRLFRAHDGKWELYTDYMNGNGDGLSNLVQWINYNVLKITGDSEDRHLALHLLKSVENGRGSRIEFSYAPSTDPQVVKLQSENAASYLPRISMVVTSTKVSGGYGTPTMITRYQYENPAFMHPNRRNNEPHQFLGFKKTISTTMGSENDSPKRRIVKVYAYDQQGDPNGRVIDERIYRGEAGEFYLHEYKKTTWQQRPLFSGQVRFTHRDMTLTRTCNPGLSEEECLVQTDNVYRIKETWEPWIIASKAVFKKSSIKIRNSIKAPSLSNITQTPANKKKLSGTEVELPPDAKIKLPKPLLYLKKLVQEGSGLVEGELDRKNTYNYQVRYGQWPFQVDDYRVLVEETINKEARLTDQNITFEKTGQTKTHYENFSGLPMQSDQWMNDSTIASTKRTFYPFTGILLSEPKPEQASPRGSGKKTTYTYDAHMLFVDTTKNELDHKVITTYDVATGTMLQRKGPNYLHINGNTIWNGEKWTIDGFGRTIDYAVSVEHELNGYVLNTIQKTTYFDHESPNRIHKQQLRDFGGNLWIKNDQTSDGLGRILKEIEYLEGNQDVVTTYNYDAAGNLAAIDTPDPRFDDGSSVRYSYQYDGMNRLIRFTRPDTTGISITYSGLEKTLTEVTYDGSGSKTKQVFDVLDRLIEVHEYNPESSTAITRYKYDADDNLIQVTDAEGNVTFLGHDWVGNRTRIKRGQRVWSYEYDKNGNMIAEISPVPGGANTANYKNIYLYDELDRVSKSIPAPREMSTTRMAELGIGPIHYEYDKNKNGIGQLSHVLLPFGNIQYQYNTRGLIAFEQRSFEINHLVTVADTQFVTRNYNALGKPTLVQWDDGQNWKTSYDERGLVATVEWFDPQENKWQKVADCQRSVTGQVRKRNTAYGQIREFTYDILGRPVTDIILKSTGPMADLDSNVPSIQPVSTRDYTYSDAGDLKSLSGSTADFIVSANYSYDAMHRLKTASGPNNYSGSFTYSPTGNLKTASVTWQDSPNTRNVHYVYGAVDPQAVDRLENIVGSGNYAEFKYDLSGNMVKRITPSGVWLFTWDGENQLREARGPNGTEVYLYDHNNQRMLAVNPGDSVRFWFGENETHYNSNGTKIQRYLHLSDGGSSLARVENGSEIELQYADALQNHLLSLDKEGNIVASFGYGGFGEVVQDTGEDKHRRQFNGKENDNLTGLGYYGYRYYDPLILRWISADPLYRFAQDTVVTNFKNTAVGKVKAYKGKIAVSGLKKPQKLNLYTFNLNNSLRYYDPDGLWPWDDYEIDWDAIGGAAEWVWDRTEYWNPVIEINKRWFGAVKKASEGDLKGAGEDIVDILSDAPGPSKRVKVARKVVGKLKKIKEWFQERMRAKKLKKQLDKHPGRPSKKAPQHQEPPKPKDDEPPVFHPYR